MYCLPLRRPSVRLFIKQCYTTPDFPCEVDKGFSGGCIEVWRKSMQYVRTGGPRLLTDCVPDQYQDIGIPISCTEPGAKCKTVSPFPAAFLSCIESPYSCRDLQIMRNGQPAYYYVNKSCDPFCQPEVLWLLVLPFDPAPAKHPCGRLCFLVAG